MNFCHELLYLVHVNDSSGGDDEYSKRQGLILFVCIYGIEIEHKRVCCVKHVRGTPLWVCSL